MAVNIVSLQQIVQQHIPLCPIKISTGHVNSDCAFRTAQCRVNCYRPCISKQIEDRLSPTLFRDLETDWAMIEKKSRIEVVFKINPELTLPFLDLMKMFCLSKLLILIPAFLATASFQKYFICADIQYSWNNGNDFPDPQLCFGFLDSLWCFIFLHMDPTFLTIINIDSDGIVW